MIEHDTDPNLTEPAPEPTPEPLPPTPELEPVPEPQPQTEEKDGPHLITEELPVGHVVEE